MSLSRCACDFAQRRKLCRAAGVRDSLVDWTGRTGCAVAGGVCEDRDGTGEGSLALVRYARVDAKKNDGVSADGRRRICAGTGVGVSGIMDGVVRGGHV